MDQSNEIVMAHLHRLIKQINLAYQAMRDERRQLAQWESDREFSVLGEIELLTSHLQGHAGQVLTGQCEKPDNVLAALQKTMPFEIAPIFDWYLTNGEQYPQICDYLETLDYLRLLLVEYLSRTTVQVAV